jgi:hypothetical protein
MNNQTNNARGFIHENASGGNILPSGPTDPGVGLTLGGDAQVSPLPYELKSFRNQRPRLRWAPTSARPGRGSRRFFQLSVQRSDDLMSMTGLGVSMFMYIITEYATVLLVVLPVTALVFTVCPIFLVLEERCSVAARKVKKSLTNGDIPLLGSWRTAEPRRCWSRRPLLGR